MAITDPVDARGHTIADAIAQEPLLMLDNDDGTTLALTGVAATDVFTTDDDHGLAVGDRVAISGLTGGTGFTAGDYTVATVPSATTFTLEDSDGVAVDFSTDITAGSIIRAGEAKMTLAQSGAEVQAQIDNVPGEAA